MKSILKTLTTITFLFLLSNTVHAQYASKILKEYKGSDESLMISIPGFIAKTALKSQTNDKEFKKAIKKMNGLQIMISEENNGRKQKRMMNDFNRLFKKHDYKQLFQVKSDGDIISLQFLPGTKSHKGEFVMLIDSDEDFIAMVVEGKFTENDVEQIAQNINVKNFK